MFKYEINGKTYVQKPLVLGQIIELLNHIENFEIPPGTPFRKIPYLVGIKLSKGFAIALVEEGKSPKREKEEIDSLADELEFAIDGDTSTKVIEDFFDCNPVVSILTRLSGITKKAGISFEIKSKKPSSSSPEETSQEETPSSGDSPRENASPGSEKEAET